MEQNYLTVTLSAQHAHMIVIIIAVNMWILVNITTLCSTKRPPFYYLNNSCQVLTDFSIFL